MKTQNFEQLTNEALDAFWDVVVRRYPEATTGDLSPLTTIRLQTAAEDAVSEWVIGNVPRKSRFKPKGE